MKLKDYRLDENTLALFPEYENGEKLTKVFSRNGNLVVEQTQEAILDATLRYYGSSLRGAREGAKSVLGNIKRTPIMVNEILAQYWFPTASPTHKDCIWLAFHHILDFEAIDKTHTKVRMSGGGHIVVSISKSSLESKIQRTCILRYEIETRTNRAREQIREVSVKYEVIKLSGQLNYTFRELGIEG